MTKPVSQERRYHEVEKTRQASHSIQSIFDHYDDLHHTVWRLYDHKESKVHQLAHVDHMMKRIQKLRESCNELEATLKEIQTEIQANNET